MSHHIDNNKPVASPPQHRCGDISFNHETGDMKGQSDCCCKPGEVKPSKLDVQIEQYLQLVREVNTRRDELVAAALNIGSMESAAAVISSLGDIDFSKFAKEQTLTNALQLILTALAPKATKSQLDTATETILTAISHIDIDTTTLAKEQTLTNALQSVLTALNPKATTNDVTTAKDAILEALSHISPEDPYSQALAAFFNITPPVPNAVPMTQQEVEDDLDELWNLIINQ